MLAPQRSFTIGMIRLLRRLGPVQRRRRIPRQLQPDLIRKGYLDALRPFVQVALDEFAKVRTEIVQLLMSVRREQKQDASPDDQAQTLIRHAAEKATAALDPSRLYDVAKLYGDRTDKWQREQLDKQVRAAMAVPLGAIEPQINAKLESFARENVALIKTVPERYFERLQGDVRKAFESGMHPNTFAELLESRDEMAEDDAARIARDQIGKLQGQLNEERQTQMGVTGYVWRTANDNRVRDEHAEREGQHFEWDDPPEDGHPGEAILCRCYAEPDFSPILEAIEDQ